MATVPRFFQAPASHFFLFGPRGTGKSTWLRQAFPDALWVDLLRPEVHREYAARPERLRQLVAGNPGRPVVVIDEVQKAPVLLDVVHDLIEQRAGPRFVLTGSSSRKLKREGVDLLAGRALLRCLHPFLAAELGDRFRLDTALTQGLVPLVWGSPEPEETLKAYVALYLREEVQMEGLVRRFESFARFEVKHSATIRPADLRGFKAFREDYPEAELILLYRGDEAREVDGIRCLPCEGFLRELVPGRPLPSPQ